MQIKLNASGWHSIHFKDTQIMQIKLNASGVAFDTFEGHILLVAVESHLGK